MPKRIGSGEHQQKRHFFPVEIRDKELIALLVKAQDREGGRNEYKGFGFGKKLESPDPGTLRSTKLLKEKVHNFIER